nr:G-protein coupled receptor GRL101-like [Penaeus vannamei]
MMHAIVTETNTKGHGGEVKSGKRYLPTDTEDSMRHLTGNSIISLDTWALYGLSSLSTLNETPACFPKCFVNRLPLVVLARLILSFNLSLGVLVLLQDLSRQGLSNISQHAFMGLRTLLSLNLSHNEIQNLADGTFSGLSSLLSLDVRSNRVAVMGSRVFSSLGKLDHLWTDEFRFCCLARGVGQCHPPPDEFSSCEDLMSNIMLRVSVWVLGTLALSGNFIVIVWRIYESDNKVHSFLITNLALGDLCMGFYLIIIAAVDVNYRGVYFIYDAIWRSSSLCQLAGFFSTFSSELSVFTLTVITLERFSVIIFPFRTTRLNMQWTKIIMGVVWACVGVLAALPLADIHYFRNFYGRSGVCLALHITHEKPSGWEYSVFVFLVLNFLSFSVIAASYWGMYRAARTSSAAVRNDHQRRESNMAKRMTAIVVTDAACWMPIILLGIVSLAGVRIPPQVFAWVAVFVLPLNAAVNPLLYTLSTAPFLGKARERVLDVRHSFKRSVVRRTLSTSTGESAGAEATAVIRPLDVAALTTVISPFHRAFLHPHDNVHTVLSHVHGNKSAHKRDTYLPCSHAFSARRRHSLHGLDCVHTVREMDKMRVPPEGEIITLRDLTLQTSPPLARQVSSRSSRKKSSKHLQDLYD